MLAHGQRGRGMESTVFERFLNADSGQLGELREHISIEGYSGFYSFLEKLKARIKWFADDETDSMRELLDKAMHIVPNPGALSPSWTYIWERLDRMIQCKIGLLQAVPPQERDGEWQVLIDNPFMNREVACYPALSFMEASYIYAQFRPDLENNEYIRLQKIQTHITESGRSRV